MSSEINIATPSGKVDVTFDVVKGDDGMWQQNQTWLTLHDPSGPIVKNLTTLISGAWPTREKAMEQTELGIRQHIADKYGA